jgi:hypothetical protein
MTAGSTPKKTVKKTPASAGPAPTPKFKGRVQAGIEILNRKNKSTNQGPYQDFDTSNRFRFYSQLATCTPHASISLNKLGFSLVKNARFTGKNRIVKNFEAWSRRTHFLDQLQTIGRLVPRDVIYIAEGMGKDSEKFWMKPLLMPYITILGEGLKPGDQVTDIMQPPISNIVVNEVLNSGDKQKKTYKPEELVYGTFGAWDYKQPDVLGRETYGIYGASFMEPLAVTIQNFLGLDQGYISFVRKYGLGRYLFDFELLEKLVAEGVITYDEAQAAIDDFNEKHQYLSENEDISALGLKVDAIDAKGSLDIKDFRDSLVAEIQIGLLQSPLVMGKASGTTYASAYMAEEDRMLVLEGLQRTIEDIGNDIINRRLALMKQPEDSIQIEFEKLSRINLTAAEMQEMYNTGVISKYQFQFRTGFADEEDETTGTE